jgi:hypothetical protein
MLTDVTVKVPPRLAIPDASPEADVLDGVDALDDDEDGDDAAPEAPPPENRPITVTWCPTCAARLTPESAINFSSLVSPAERLELAALLEEAVDDGLLDAPSAAGGVPACAPGLLGLVELVALPLEPPLNLTLFRTKPPPPALLEELDALAVVSLFDAPLPRCRQPVALVGPAFAPVDDCGVDVVGLCAASVPHSTTAVLSVTAHCR